MKLSALLGFAVCVPSTMATIYCRDVSPPGDTRSWCRTNTPAWQGCQRFCSEHCRSTPRDYPGGCMYHLQVGGDYDCFCK
uniref:SIX15 n=1 Tax=Fusarium oxysporum f. sp. physali TaxID=2212625 RepID=A0A2U9DMR5_FUSOX|nr:SIX15 [Fusarium oxysporum f. sp. physali]